MVQIASPPCMRAMYAAARTGADDASAPDCSRFSSMAGRRQCAACSLRAAGSEGLAALLLVAAAADATGFVASMLAAGLHNNLAQTHLCY